MIDWLKTPVDDTSDLKQRLIDTCASIITKRHRLGLVEVAVTCKHERERTSLWIMLNWNRLFSEPPTVYLGKHDVSRNFYHSYLKANKVSKSEGTRKVEYARDFRKYADAVYQKLFNVSACLSKLQLAKVGAFLRHRVDVGSWRNALSRFVVLLFGFCLLLLCLRWLMSEHCFSGWLAENCLKTLWHESSTVRLMRGLVACCLPVLWFIVNERTLFAWQSLVVIASCIYMLGVFVISGFCFWHYD